MQTPAQRKTLQQLVLPLCWKKRHGLVHSVGLVAMHFNLALSWSFIAGDLAMWEAGGVHSLQARQLLHGAQSTSTAENYFVNSQPNPTVCSRQISPKSKGLYLKYRPQKLTSWQILQSKGKATVPRFRQGTQQKVEPARFLIQKIFQIASDVFGVPWGKK